MKIIFIILISLVSMNCLAQKKTPITITTDPPQQDSIAIPRASKAKEVAKYEKIVKVKLSDLHIMLNAMNRLKELEMYNPKSTDKQKVDNFKSIENHLIRLSATLKIDSVEVEAPKPKK